MPPVSYILPNNYGDLSGILPYNIGIKVYQVYSDSKYWRV